MEKKKRRNFNEFMNNEVARTFMLIIIITNIIVILNVEWGKLDDKSDGRDSAKKKKKRIFEYSNNAKKMKESKTARLGETIRFWFFFSRQKREQKKLFKTVWIGVGWWLVAYPLMENFQSHSRRESKICQHLI